MGDVLRNIRIRLPLLNRFREDVQQPHCPEETARLLRGRDPDQVQAAVTGVLDALESQDSFGAIRHWMTVAPLLHSYVVVERGALPADVLDPGWQQPLNKALIDLVPARCCDTFAGLVYPGSLVRCPWCGVATKVPTPYEPVAETVSTQLEKGE